MEWNESRVRFDVFGQSVARGAIHCLLEVLGLILEVLEYVLSRTRKSFKMLSTFRRTTQLGRKVKNSLSINLNC